MYFGKVVEIGDTDSIFEKAEHPYTKRLLSAVPGLEAIGGADALAGASAAAETEGNEWRLEGCTHDLDEAPMLVRRGPDHFVACHHPN